MMKEVMWKDELEIDKVSKNRQDEEILDVCIFYDRKSSSGDINWKVKVMFCFNVEIWESWIDYWLHETASIEVIDKFGGYEYEGEKGAY